jgi:DEAD/DEAH box helicase domain-containing protein
MNEPTKNEVIFDLETRRSSDEVGGWRNAAHMGLSIAVTFQTAASQYHVYGEHNVQELIAELQAADRIIGFNLLRFDYVVLSAYTRCPLHELPTLDMLAYIHRKLGHYVSLDDLAVLNLGETKSASGLQAIAWWREGQLQPLIEYCLLDVDITRALYTLGQIRGYLEYPDRGRVRKVKVKW